MVVQLAKKFSAIYGKFAGAPHSATWMQSTFVYPVSLSCIVISFPLRLAHTSGLSTSGFQAQLLCVFLVSLAPSYLLGFIALLIPSGEEWELWNFLLCNLTQLSVISFLWNTYIFLKYLVLIPCQFIYFLHCERPSLSPIQKSRQNYSYVYLNFTY
jgi:hypothetical protein